MPLRKLPLVKHAPHVGKEDLIQEATLAVSRARGFDPARGSAAIRLRAERRQSALCAPPATPQ